MRFLLCFTLLVAGLTSVSAQTVRVDRIEIVNYGVYSGTLVKNEPLAGTVGGVNTVQNRKLVKQTETITGRLGERFGIQYTLRGRPNGKVVGLTYVTRFPPPGIVNEKGEKLEKSQFAWNDKIGEPGIRTYSFDHSWEIVPGVWTLEFYYEGRKIGEKSFNVVLP